MNIGRIIGVLGVVTLAATGPVGAQATAAKKAPSPPQSTHVMVTSDSITWGAAPPSLPPGAQAAFLAGDPGKAGLFIVRLKFPDGYAVPPHSHPTDEHVTVISGTLSAGLGDKADESAMHVLSAGGYANMPARTNHYVRAKGETIVQVNAMGPFEVKYVNPNDDPRKKATSGK